MTGRRMIVLAVSAIMLWPTQVRAAGPVAKDPSAENAALVYYQAFLFVPKLDKAEKSALLEVAGGQGPIGEELVAVLTESVTALKELYRGAKLSRCVWGLEREAGPHALMPYLSEARELAGLACLRARCRFVQGEASGAIDDLTAAMTLGRHTATDGLLISVLVDYAIEGIAIDCAADYVPTLDPESLDKLAGRVEAMPPHLSAKEAVLAEKAVFGGWMVREMSKAGGKEKLMELIGEVDDPHARALAAMSQEELARGAVGFLDVYDELAKIMELPPDAAKKAEEELLGRLDDGSAAGHVASMMLPAASAMRHNEAVHQAHEAMFKAGIAVARSGEAELERKEHQDPFGGGFEYKKLDGGFRLRSKLKDRQDEPVTLTFGKVEEE